MRLPEMFCFITLFLYCFPNYRGKKSITTFVHRKLESDFEEGEAMVKSLVQKFREKSRFNSVEL